MRTTMAFILLALCYIASEISPDVTQKVAGIAAGYAWTMLFVGWLGKVTKGERR